MIPKYSNGNVDTPLKDVKAKDVAIVGMACRCAGGIKSPSQLWEFLLRKGDASREIEPWRWAPYHKWSRRNAATLKETTSSGYFMDGLQDFDPGFFSISAYEAEQMDPQQRIALEVTWEALEDAGIPPQSLAGSSTALYMGVGQHDYSELTYHDVPHITAHMGIGNSHCGIPGRISHLLDLRGPHSAIDAACASSMVAIHLARQAILSGETGLAIAGGVNVTLSPTITRVLDQAGVISPDGKCRSFDDAAQGYGRGEGVGIIILKELDQAIQHGDHIHAILKGSAVGSDGRTDGIMAPCPDAQKAVACKALSNARMTPDLVHYLEAHATSTAIGDPAEVQALAQVYGYGSGREKSTPCYIGSVKPNIGHLESAAGVMGLIKAVLVLQNRIVPPQANLTHLNTKIAWDQCLLELCLRATPIRDQGLLRAAVASYGYSGAVSHAVLESFPQPSQGSHDMSANGDMTAPLLLLISATHGDRMREIAAELKDWMVKKENKSSLYSIANTLGRRRGHHRFRAAIIASTMEEAISGLAVLSEAGNSRLIVEGRVSPAAAKGAVWVFSGHGSHWGAMGQELYRSRPAFTRVVQNLEPIFHRELDMSITEILKTGNIAGTDLIQVMTFVMHLGIAAVLEEEAGLPSAVVGHSLGEAAAAVIAGSITWKEAALIVSRRTRLFRTVMGKGACLFTGLTADVARQQIQGKDGLAVAIDASPGSCVVSGPTNSIRTLAEDLNQEGIEVYLVPTDIAFHNPLLCELADPLRRAMQGELHPQPPRIQFYSTSQRDPRAATAHGIEYWINGMLCQVYFQSSIRAILEDGFRAFVEVSSHPIVTRAIHEISTQETESECLITHTGVRNKPMVDNILHAAGSLHCFGCHIPHISPDGRIPWVSTLPKTKWQHKRLWITTSEEEEATSVPQNRTHNPALYDLLGERIPIYGTDQILYQTSLDRRSRPYPASHTLHGSEIVPVSVLLNTLLHATSTNVLEDVSLKVPVVVEPPRELQILVDSRQARITSRVMASDDLVAVDSSWHLNTACKWSGRIISPSLGMIDLVDLRDKLLETRSSRFSLDYLASIGVPDMAFPWTVLKHISNDREMLVRVDLDPDGLLQTTGSWATLFDAATSIGSSIFHREPRLRMPTSIRRVILRDQTQCCPRICYIHCSLVTEVTCTIDITACTEDGKTLSQINGLAFKGVEGEYAASSGTSTNDLIHYVTWRPAPWAETPRDFQWVDFFTDKNPSPSVQSRLERYQTQLRLRGLESSVHTNPLSVPSNPKTAIIYIVDGGDSTFAHGIALATARSCEGVVKVTQQLLRFSSNRSQNLFIIVKAENGRPPLGCASLYGLSRIIAAEHPEIWGGLIECEDESLPLAAIRYIQDQDVIRIQDEIPRTACFRSFPNDTAREKRLTFSKAGTYLIAGGRGGIGLEVAQWMVHSGARRLLLISRCQMLPRSFWNPDHDDHTVRRILAIEELGATVHHISLDISSQGSATALADAIEKLQLPPVVGVIHAAGVVDNQLVEQITSDQFNAAIAAKVQGALCLDTVFPAGQLDFFLLFSSIGYQLGVPGQASYASGNAFLDALAAQRRAMGDNAMSLQWSNWRGIGMAARSEYMDAELEARHISSLSRDEAFKAWAKIATSLDTDHAAIFRTLPMDKDEPLCHPILREIRRQKEPTRCRDYQSPVTENVPITDGSTKKSLAEIITSCVAETLSISEAEVDPLISLQDMGMDSVLSVGLRRLLQNALRVNVPPTFTWKYPTVQHMVKHFYQ